LTAWAGDALTPFSFGAVGDASTDDTIALNLWLAAGGGLLPVPFGGYYKVTGTLVISVAGTKIIGMGRASLIKLVLSASTPAVPVIDVRSSAVGTLLQDFGVDGGGANLAQNTVYGGDLAASSGVILQANGTVATGLFVTNTFGNGIFCAQYASSSGGFNANQPQNLIVSNISTVTCGIGVSSSVTKPGKNGAGIDFGGCAGSTLTNCVDNQSYTGFIIDVGDGAMCMVSNLTAFYTQLDTLHPTNGSGTGFYFGSSNCQISNCAAISTGGHGYWLDGAGLYNQISNCYARYCGGFGFAIKGSDWQLSNCVAYNCSQSTVNNIAGFTGHGSTPQWDAFAVVAVANITNLTLSDCMSYGNSHQYGYAEYPGAYSITAAAIGGAFYGLNGAGITSGAFAGGMITTGRVNTSNVGSNTTTLNLGTVNGTSLQIGDGGGSTSNFAFIKGAVGGSNTAVQIGAYTNGSDTEIDLKFVPFGASGVVQFGTYTAGAPTATGYITVKDSAGNLRKLVCA